MTTFTMSLDELLAGLREGRFGEQTALRWLEGSVAEARRARHVRAHWDPATRSQVIDALDSALGSDEFSGLFPPSSPLGGEHEEEPNTGLVYPGEEQGRRDRRPVTSWDGYVPASRPRSAMSPVTNMPDEEAALLWPPGSEEEADRRASEAARVRAARVEDLADEELHEMLFGSTTGPEAGG